MRLVWSEYRDGGDKARSPLLHNTRKFSMRSLYATALKIEYLVLP